jgi:GNAT superfamily N-acetyltransferase
MKRSVTTTYLEMNDRSQVRPARSASVDFQLLRAELPCPELNRILYTAVGAEWWWYTRLPWDYSRWLAYVDRPELETWIAYAAGTPAGYFELERQDGENVEIAYFGLLPNFIGKGLGGALLSAAVSSTYSGSRRRLCRGRSSCPRRGAPEGARGPTERGFRGRVTAG